MDNVFIGLSVALPIVDVPTKRLEERIEKFPPKLCFVVLGGTVDFSVPCESSDKILDFLGCAHVAS
jgi:hypothetical protein